MKIGFIGLGIMGSGMAANLQKADFSLVVHDLAEQAAAAHIGRGAVWAATPRAVGEVCDVVFTSLPTPADVEAVGTGSQGLVAGLRAGSAWFDLSTNAVDVVRRLHEMVAPTGAAFLDAPVSGGPAGAVSGKLAIWVGGDKAVFDRFQPVLAAMSDQARLVGPIGAGSIAKLTHNLASTALATLLAEVVTVGVKAGVEPLPLWEAIRQGSAGRQNTFEIFGARVLPGNFDPPNFALRLLHKDVGLAVQLGREVGVPMRLSNLAYQELTEAMNRGWGGRDSLAYTLLQQERAGITPFDVAIEEIRAVQTKG
jgi:3-hydroxyisobutyrate dehydrogenase